MLAVVIHLVLEYYKTRLYQKRIYQYVEPKPYEDKGQYNMPKTPHALLKKRMADKIISYGAPYSCHCHEHRDERRYFESRAILGK